MSTAPTHPIKTLADVQAALRNPETKNWTQARPHAIRERLGAITRHHSLENLPAMIGQAKAAPLVAEHAELSAELALLYQHGLK
ncbi:hypothetical protein GO003_018975 [Methylicorpusculum oleiharenae]|uniref:hypothetical protein n=1 Tax=Methylicorpusculum oleiharenae TaxID=1338687 RepID=UPI00135B2887|nr:hypothetical protein [Methylicorpusculum oleiharenae]MCD2452471.1 hypothetical protein [Methylicorpusculum oleiharenae]